jgi:hypothetical protein
VLLFDLVE